MKKRTKSYGDLYTFTYLAIGVMIPLVSQYLKSIGFTGTEIGTITASGTCVAIFASAFWGKIYTLCNRKHLMVMSLCLLAAIMGLLLSRIHVYEIFLLCFCIMYFFQAPVMSLSDALVMEDKQPFGFIRMFGAAGFSVGVFIAARVAASMGLNLIFIMYAISYIIAALVMLSLNKKENIYIKKEKKKIKGYKTLFCNKKYMMLIICAFFMCGTNVANNTYFSFLYIKGGGTLVGVGIAFLLMAGSEAPVMGWTTSLARRFTTEKLILIAMIISVLRFAWYATCPSYIMLIVLFGLQGMVNGIILVEFVKYVSKIATKELGGVAIAMYYSFSSSTSTILCQLIGGVLLDKFGAGGVYLFFSVFNLIGLVLYVAFGLYKKE